MKMRQFHGLTFLGNGEFSKKECDALHKRLDDGLNLSGHKQQGSMPTRMLVELEDVVRDIVAALIGRSLEFAGVLPYPPRPKNLTPVKWKQKVCL